MNDADYALILNHIATGGRLVTSTLAEFERQTRLRDLWAFLPKYKAKARKNEVIINPSAMHCYSISIVLTFLGSSGRVSQAGEGVWQAVPELQGESGRYCFPS